MNFIKAFFAFFTGSQAVKAEKPQVRLTPAEEARAKQRLSHDLKLQRAKEWLGKDWVMHPEYVPNPRHSCLDHLWWHNRTCKAQG